MKIVITGGNGQLGMELTRQLRNKYELYPLTKNQLDVTNKKEVFTTLIKIKPDLIIHAAAYTAVDQSERKRNEAFATNTLGTYYIANAASNLGARLFYISTDYVFDGTKPLPYEESDQPNPLSVYGMSKWLGERFVVELVEQHTIIRTSWLYGLDRKNFVKTVLERGKAGKELRVVNDQFGSPTYTNDLVRAMEQLIEKEGGIYHVSNSGACSWYAFAQAILFEAGLEHHLLKPIETKDYQSVAIRPPYSVLAHKKLITVGIEKPRHWREALKEFIRQQLSVGEVKVNEANGR